MSVASDRKKFPNLVNRAELARMLGYSPPTIDRLIDAGLPFEKQGGRGREWGFDPRKAIRWLIARRDGEAQRQVKDSIERDKGRLLAARARIAELRFMESTGEMVSAADVGAGWIATVTLFKQRMLSIPSRAAPLLAVEMDIHECNKILEGFCREALAELNDPQSPEGVTE